MLFLTGCRATNNAPYNNCRQFVETYGDAVECMIQLDTILLTVSES
jgi:hypothetical protein